MRRFQKPRGYNSYGSKTQAPRIAERVDFIGEGISFCAVCDGAFYKDKIVGVVGGGNSALQETVLLAEGAKKVYLIQKSRFSHGEKKLQDKIFSLKNVEIITGATVKSLLGDRELAGIEVVREKDGISYEISLDGLFIAIGLLPQNEPFEKLISLTTGVTPTVTRAARRKRGGFLSRAIAERKKVRQVTTAAADGAAAAIAACDYLDSLN